jgi:two-component system OmpR family response regulator
VKHILVADDEATIRLLLEKILESAGYRVTSVPDGAAALKAARDDPPDLAICDLCMPGIDGLTACSMLKHAKTFKAPVLVLSGQSGEEDAVTRLKAGADALITKPVERQQLLSKVAEWLEVAERRAAEGA